jgi:hypothetical protein
MTQGAFFRSAAIRDAAFPVCVTTRTNGSGATRNRQRCLNLQDACAAASASIGRRSMPPGNPGAVPQPGRERPRLWSARQLLSAARGVAHAPVEHRDADLNPGGNNAPYGRPNRLV